MANVEQFLFTLPLKSFTRCFPAISLYLREGAKIKHFLFSLVFMVCYGFSLLFFVCFYVYYKNIWFCFGGFFWWTQDRFLIFGELCSSFSQMRSPARPLTKWGLRPLGLSFIAARSLRPLSFSLPLSSSFLSVISGFALLFRQSLKQLSDSLLAHFRMHFLISASRILWRHRGVLAQLHVLCMYVYVQGSA